MKITRGLAAAAVALLVSPGFAQDKPKLETPAEKGSYALGVNAMSNARKQGLEIDLDLFMRGMRDAAANGPYLISDEEIRIAIKNYQTQVRRQQSAASSLAAEENEQKSREFLEANKSAEGVVTLASGLQYRVIKTGSGKTPTDADTVLVNFRGTLPDGTEFNRSEPGKPAQVRVGNALPAWREALKLMPEGSLWRIFVPAALAYGARGNPGTAVGPNQALVFDLEAVSAK